MNIMLGLWLAATLAALLLLYISALNTKQWRGRQVWAEVALGLVVAGLPFIVGAPLSWYGKGAALILSVVCMLLAARIVKGRLDEAFLRRSTLLNVGMMAVLVGGFMAWHSVVVVWSGREVYEWWVVIGLLMSALVGIAGVAQLLWTMRHYRLRLPERPLTLRETPTVSLCIPARNETHALTECLSAAIASDYPKLEILVLDDCSQDATSHIIRGFAHDGVRFVQGEAPAEGWLGKNQAMRVLAEHATGDFIVFADVDTLVAPHSLTKLVQYAVSHQLDMVSILPQNRLGVAWGAVLSTLQYYWQIVLPVTARRVPVASKCWLVRRKALEKLGGFASVKHKIVPEGSFARRLHSTDAYRFLVSTPELGFTTAKRWGSQLETSLRLLYPTFKRQPVFVMVGIAALTIIGLLPFAALLYALIRTEWTALTTLAFVTSGIFIMQYALVLVRTHPRSWWLATALLPFVLMQELMLLWVSMLKYEFGQVDWKGRNVCYPVIALPPGRPRFFGRGRSRY